MLEGRHVGVECNVVCNWSRQHMSWRERCKGQGGWQHGQMLEGGIWGWSAAW